MSDTPCSLCPANNFDPIAGSELSSQPGTSKTTELQLRSGWGFLGNPLEAKRGSSTAISSRVTCGSSPELVAVTTLFVREHNFQVAQLAKAHPD